jgi:hypothetical protein
VFTTSSGGESIEISSGGSMLVWVIALFGLRTICSTLISWASSFYTLHPGDILLTGTPEGVAAVVPGDTMVGAVAGLGELKVKVV